MIVQRRIRAATVKVQVSTTVIPRAHARQSDSRVGKKNVPREGKRRERASDCRFCGSCCGRRRLGCPVRLALRSPLCAIVHGSACKTAKRELVPSSGAGQATGERKRAVGDEPKAAMSVRPCAATRYRRNWLNCVRLPFCRAELAPRRAATVAKQPVVRGSAEDSTIGNGLVGAKVWMGQVMRQSETHRWARAVPP